MICEIGTMFWHFSDLNNVIKCPQCHEMNLIITNEYPRGFETGPCDLWKGIINNIMDKATTIRRFVNLATNNRTQSFFRKKLCKYPAKSSVNFGQPCLCARAVKADEK